MPTQEPVTKTPVSERYLILDSNILSRASSSTDGPGPIGNIIIPYLQEVLNRSPGWDIAISAATIFEVTDRSPIKEEVRLERAVEGMKIFDVNIEVLRCAGRLGCMYKDQGINDTQISSVDKIIAATAFLTGSVIYTTDMRDYPAPFFSENRALRKIVEYEAKKVPVFLPTYFMNPENDVLQKYYLNRVAEAPSISEKLKLVAPVKALVRIPEQVSSVENVESKN